MKSSKLINSFIINGVLAIICLCWTVPTFGLLISSFRDRIDINRTRLVDDFPSQGLGLGGKDQARSRSGSQPTHDL